MPEGKVAFLLTGQGITSWEKSALLAETSPAAADVYEEAYDSIGLDVPRICKDASENPIDDTRIVQPLLVAVTVAGAEDLRSRGIKPDYLIPHSVGAFAAAALSKSLSLKDALVAVRQRGVYLHEEGNGKGGLLAVKHPRGMRIDKVIKGITGVYPATMNSPMQSGVAFIKEKYGSAKDAIKESGAISIRVKNLEFPPHCEVVYRAQERLAELLRDMSFHDAEIPIYSFNTVRLIKKAKKIREDLVAGVTGAVRFKQCIESALRNGVTEFYEPGPSDVLSRLLGDFSLKSNILINPVIE